MSGEIGTWQPAIKVEVTEQLLTRYLGLIENTDLNAIGQSFPAEEISKGAALMKLQAADWQAAEQLDNTQIEQLIRFFTLAEAQLAGWDAGQTSPVIYLVKVLKNRSAFDPELKKWIKRNTDNRYLPNGAVLL